MVINVINLFVAGQNGVWFVKTREEYNAALQYMNHVIPDCEFITTELIEVSVYFADR